LARGDHLKQRARPKKITCDCCGCIDQVLAVVQYEKRRLIAQRMSNTRLERRYGRAGQPDCRCNRSGNLIAIRDGRQFGQKDGFIVTIQSTLRNFKR
jgi:hypothetical protein